MDSYQTKHLDLTFINALCIINVFISLLLINDFDYAIFLLLFQFLIGIYVYLISHPLNWIRLQHLKATFLKARKWHFALATVYLILLVLGFYKEDILSDLTLNLSIISQESIFFILICIIPQMFFYTYIWISNKEAKLLKSADSKLI